MSLEIVPKTEGKEAEVSPPEKLTDILKILSPHVQPLVKALHVHGVISTICDTLRMIAILVFAAVVLNFVYKVHSAGDDNLAEKTIIGLFGFMGGFLAGKKTDK